MIQLMTNQIYKLKKKEYPLVSIKMSTAPVYLDPLPVLPPDYTQSQLSIRLEPSLGTPQTIMVLFGIIL